jgi:ATP phosphoribosyltransferase regulatory subunit
MESSPKGIRAPYMKGDAKLEEKMEQLRNEGQVVIVDLPGHEYSQDIDHCDRKLTLKHGSWAVVSI